MLRLTFPGTAAAILPSHDRGEPQFVEGRDATEVLEAWRTRKAGTGSWSNYSPADFRTRIVGWSGAEGVSGESEDAEILDAVVRALGPDVVKLTRTSALQGRPG